MNKRQQRTKYNFVVPLKFDPVKTKNRKYDVRFTFNEQSEYFEENIDGNEDFCSTIFQPFQFEHEQKKTRGNETHEKETKQIYASSANLLHMQMQALQKRSERNRSSLL